MKTSFMSMSLDLPTASILDIKFKSFCSSTIFPLLVLSLLFFSIVENVLSFVAGRVAKRSGSFVNTFSNVNNAHFCSPIIYEDKINTNLV